jgi:hypothetical protein
LSVKGTGIETDCPGRRVLFSDILHKWLWGCIGSSIAGLVEGTVYLLAILITFLLKSCWMQLDLRKTVPPMN